MQVDTEKYIHQPSIGSVCSCPFSLGICPEKIQTNEWPDDQGWGFLEDNDN